MKKKLMIIIFFVILMLVGYAVIVNDDGNNNTTGDNVVNKDDEGSLKKLPDVKTKMENKDSFVLIITNSAGADTDSFCAVCEESLKFIKYYEKIYNLDIFYYDKHENTHDDYKELIKYLGVTEFPTEPPAVFYIRDGVLVFIDNEIRMEKQFKDHLIENKFIDSDESNHEIQLNTKEEYDKISGKKLIYIYTYDDNSYEYRNNLRDLSKQYNFDYYIVCNGLVGTSDIIRAFKKKYDEKFIVPSLIIIDNKNIIDYNFDKKQDKIVEFLKKNQIIKE